MLYRIFDAVNILLSLMSAAIFIYCILTWVAPRSAARYWLERFIEPICAPFRPLSRMLITRWGAPFDFTCLFALIGIRLLSQLLVRIYYMIAF